MHWGAVQMESAKLDDARLTSFDKSLSLAPQCYWLLVKNVKAKILAVQKKWQEVFRLLKSAIDVQDFESFHTLLSKAYLILGRG